MVSSRVVTGKDDVLIEIYKDGVKTLFRKLHTIISFKKGYGDICFVINIAIDSKKKIISMMKSDLLHQKKDVLISSYINYSHAKENY